MRPDQLRAELRDRGLTVLHVGRDVHRADGLVVYLHGPAGEYWGGHALHQCLAVPGVLAAEKYLPAPTILLVQVRPG